MTGRTATHIRTNFRLEALTALSHHGLLTTAQLRSIAASRAGHEPHIGSCRRALAKAADHGLIDDVCLTPWSQEKSWFLTPVGFDAVGAANPLKMTRAIALGPMTAHLGVVNNFGICATETLGADAEVSWAHEEPLPLGSGRYLRPDAVLSVLTQQGGELVGGEWFIEADRGTESIGTLVDKIANYLTYYTYRPNIPGERTVPELHWRTRFRSWPQLLFVFDCPRAHNRIERLAAWAGSDPRMQTHWNKLAVAAIAAENLHKLSHPDALTRIPAGDQVPWINGLGPNG